MRRWSPFLGAAVLAGMGENERAMEWLEHALAIDPDDNNTRYNAACTYAQMGEIDRAIDMLEIWGAHAGSDHITWFRHDADLDPADVFVTASGPDGEA